MNRSHYLGDYKALTYTYFDRKIFVDTRDIGITPHLLTDGRWEPWVSAYLETVLTPGSVFFDIGANCGFYSLLAAHHVGPNGYVLAFEPQARMVDLLRKSASVNGFDSHLHIVPKGLSNCDENLRLYHKDEFMGDASFSEPTDRFEDMSVVAAHSEVVTLEKALGRRLTPDIIKMDVEGFEPQVWEGLRPLLDRSDQCVVVMEFSPARYENQAIDARAFIDMIEEAGFAIHKLQHDGSVVPIWNADLLDGSVRDFVDLVLVKGRGV